MDARLLDGGLGQALALAQWLAGPHTGMLLLVTAFLTGLAVVPICRWFRGRSARSAASRRRGNVGDLKQRLRRRLEEATAPFGGPAAPTMGADEAFDADIEAAARTVLAQTGGQRAGAKHLLRKRLRDNGAGNGALNGSEAAYWRQLGALALLDNTREALTAYSRAADLAPDDPQAQMLLGVLALRTGRLGAAEAAFRRQMELAGSRTGETVGYRAGVMLGDVLVAKGEQDAALQAYEAAEREVAALAEQQPDNARWQRDVSIAHDRVGDLLLATGQPDLALERFRRSLAVAEALARRDPGNTGWQRDLSVTHDRIGEALERKGDLDAALASYRSGLALAGALVRREPDRPEWRWDLSVSLDRIGDVLLAKGKAGDALASYRRGLEIAEGLAKRDPMRTSWQRDLAVCCHKVGSLEATCGNESEARELLERGREIIARLARIAAHRAQWRSDLAKFDEALRGLDP